MFKIMSKMDKCDTYDRFKIILNQVRGHCFKYFKEITGNHTGKISFSTEL
jgi:hypothetical protein